jgi:copper chaperone
MANEIKTLNVEGMSCNHCVNSVKKAVGALNGVTNVEVDLKSKTVSIEFDSEKVNTEAIKDAIEDQGYDVIS